MLERSNGKKIFQMDSSISKTVISTLEPEEIEEADKTVVTQLVQELDSLMKNTKLKVGSSVIFSQTRDIMSSEVLILTSKKLLIGLTMAKCERKERLLKRQMMKFMLKLPKFDSRYTFILLIRKRRIYS